MDPITIIVTALVAGAASGLKPTAEQAVKDAYAGIKALIAKKYERVSVKTLEDDPGSEARKGVVREDLQKVNAGEDAELLLRAQAVLDAVRKHAAPSAEAVGVNIEELEAGSLEVSRIVVSDGSGVAIKKAKVAGAVKVTDVHTGGGTSKP